MQRATKTGAAMSKIANIIIIVIMFGTIALAVYNVRFTHPTIDDYRYTQRVQGKNVFEFVSERYQIWAGRFTSQAWYSIAYRMLGPHATETEYRHYRLWPLLIIGMTIASMYYYARLLLNRTRGALVKRRTRDTICLTATMLFLYMLPVRVGGTWYNISVSVAYQLAGAHFLLHIMLLCSFVQRVREDGARGWRWLYTLRLIVMALSTFSLAGYNESLALVSVLFYGMGLLWGILHDKKSVPIWFVLTIIAIISLLVIYLAPGNGHRIALTDRILATDRSMLKQGIRFVFQSVHGLLRALGTIGVPLFVLYCVPFSRRYLSLYTRAFDTFVQSSHSLFQKAVLVAYPLVVLCTFAPAIYGLGLLGPLRLHVLLHFLLVIGFGLFWANVRNTNLYRETGDYIARMRGYRGVRICAITLKYSVLLFVLVTSIAVQFDSVNDRLPVPPRYWAWRLQYSVPATVYNTFMDALYKGARYKEDSMRLIAELQNARGKSNVTVTVVCPRAKSLTSSGEVISGDYFQYPNEYLATLFNIGRVHRNNDAYCYNRIRLIQG